MISFVTCSTLALPSPSALLDNFQEARQKQLPQNKASHKLKSKQGPTRAHESWRTRHQRSVWQHVVKPADLMAHAQVGSISERLDEIQNPYIEE